MPLGQRVQDRLPRLPPVPDAMQQHQRRARTAPLDHHIFHVEHGDPSLRM